MSRDYGPSILVWCIFTWIHSRFGRLLPPLFGYPFQSLQSILSWHACYRGDLSSCSQLGLSAFRFMFSVLLQSRYFFNTLSRPVTAYLPCFSLLSSMVDEVFYLPYTSDYGTFIQLPFLLRFTNFWRSLTAFVHAQILKQVCS